MQIMKAKTLQKKRGLGSIHIYPRRRYPLFRRDKTTMEWYAPGFDPRRNVSNNDFAKAVKQSAPCFDTARLDNQRQTVMRGINVLVSTVVKDEFGQSCRRDKARDVLVDEWRHILAGESSVYHVVGTKVWPKEAKVWVYHPGAQALFNLAFATEDVMDDWLEEPIYHFA